jgi:hypothetical protein
MRSSSKWKIRPSGMSRIFEYEMDDNGGMHIDVEMEETRPVVKGDHEETMGEDGGI